MATEEAGDTDWKYISFAGATLDVDGTLDSLMPSSVAIQSSKKSDAKKKPGDESTNLESITVGSLSLAFGDNHIMFSAEEARVYRLMYLIADIQCDRSIKHDHAMAFFRYSCLATHKLEKILHLAHSGGASISGDKNATSLSYDEFFVAMKLVAQAQEIGSIDLSVMATNSRTKGYALPNFGLGSERAVSVEDDKTVCSDDEGCNDANQRCKFASISISDPIIAQNKEGALATVGLGASYVTYELEFKCAQSITCTATANRRVVMRRFRDFVWLQNRLKEKYLDTVIPPLPEKRVMGNMDDSFLAERREMLHLFLNDIARRRRLSSSVEFFIFTTASTHGMAAVRDLAPPAQSRPEPSYFSSIIDGARFYLMGAEAKPPELQKDEAYVIVENRVRTLLTQIAMVEETVRTMLEKDKHRAYELARIGHYIGQLGLCESASSSSSASTVFASFCDTFEKISSVLNDRTDIIKRELFNPVRFQSGKAVAAESVVANREQIVAELRGAMRRRSLAKKAYAQARLTDKQRSVREEQKKKIGEAEDAIDTMASALQQITMGMKTQVSQCVNECVCDIAPCVRVTAQTMREYVNKERRRWIDLKKKLQELQK